MQIREITPEQKYRQTQRARAQHALSTAMELLKSWLNDSVGLSRPVVDFEADLSNGYLFGEVLFQHGLLPSMQGLVDRETPAAKVQNLTIIQQPLLDLGVKFNTKIANELMTESKGTGVNMCYQMKLGLESAKDRVFVVEG